MTNLQLPVFYAPNGKRWKRARIFAVSLSTLVIILIGIFFFSLYVTPFLPSFSIRAKTILSQNNGLPAPAAVETSDNSSQFQASSSDGGEHPLTVGFYVNYDDTSYASLKRNIDKIDWLAPEWIRLRDGDDPLVLRFRPESD